MKMGGVSLLGSYHDINQDCFIVKQGTNGCLLAVSDGLGSHKYSQAGSAAFCQAADEVVEACGYSSNNDRHFLQELHENWRNILNRQRLPIRECGATALLAMVSGGVVQAYRLGDGFLSIATSDRNLSLFDDKEDSFTNLTDCLREEFCYDDWEKRVVTYDGHCEIIACTDGVDFEWTSDSLCEMTRTFFMEYAEQTAEEMEEDIRSWLIAMPGTDDKTIAFLEEVSSSDGIY